MWLLVVRNSEQQVLYMKKLSKFSDVIDYLELLNPATFESIELRRL